jgi:hypothetical protein
MMKKENTKEVKNMPAISEMFPIPGEAKRLEVFLGDWIVEGIITMEGNPVKVSGKWKFDKAAGGWGVKANMKMELEGMGIYEEDDLVGFDPGAGKFHIFTLTNTAATHDHMGDWKDENTLYVKYNGLQEGKRLREEITVRLAEPGQFSISEVDILEEQVIMTMDVTLKKQR